MVAALGIAASLLTDVGFKALKSITSGKSGSGTTQAGITDTAATTGQNVPAATFGSGSTDIGKLFAKIDSNGDGSISKDEFLQFKQQIDSTLTALLKTQEQAGKAGSSASASADKLFSKLDRDGDGKVSKDELQSMLAQRHHHHHRSADDGTQTTASSTGTDGNSGTSAGTTGGDDSPSSFLTALLDLQSTNASAG